MPNPKKPSDRLKEAIEPFLNEEDKTENEMFKELCQILDDQHSQIQSLQKKVEELKSQCQHCGKDHTSYAEQY